MSAADKPARRPVEGTVMPAGHTLGIVAEHTDNPHARAAYGVLLAAGHTPALLSNVTDDTDNDDDTARGTGFLIDVRRDGCTVMVGHLVDGVDMWNAMPDADRRATLRTYRDVLRADGWETDKRIGGMRLYAWRPTTQRDA